jgi:sugar phosphate isomerase/epimerase
MITYALSTCAYGNYVNPETAGALRQTQFRNYEPYFGIFTTDNERSRESRELTRQLIREGVFRSASVHLPFSGAKSWDPSHLDEEERKAVSARLVNVIRDNAELMGPMVTLHASDDTPLEEHPKRIGQVCRTIEEMLPAARELGFVINVEFLPRTCVGNCAEELQQIVSHFDADQVGICLDVNHIMGRCRELPQMIDLLAPRIRSFHISDYDGIDETHWLPGQGVHDWPELMKHIRAIDHDVLLILETIWQLKYPYREVSPYFSLRQNERAVWFLENCERLVPEIEAFRIPGK